MKRKPLTLLLLIASLCFSLSGSAFASSRNEPEQKSIERLEKQQDLEGDSKDRYSPKQQMTVASAVSLIVKGMELNIDNIRFIKKPKASDYFTKTKDNAWYAQSFIIAQLNGLEVPKNIDPAAYATREQFAHWLFKAISKKGEYAWIQLYVTINDEKAVNPAYMESVQKLLIAKIAELDSKQNFRPKQPVTRSAAAGMLDRAMQFVKKVKPIEPVDPETAMLTEIKLTSDKVNDELVKVTVSAMAPHAGYGLEISSITFRGAEAIVNYRLILPDPAAFYAQVITEVKATAYISAKYKPVLGTQEHSEPSKKAPVAGRHPIKNPDGSVGGSPPSGVPNGR